MSPTAAMLIFRCGGSGSGSGAAAAGGTTTGGGASGAGADASGGGCVAQPETHMTIQKKELLVT